MDLPLPPPPAAAPGVPPDGPVAPAGPPRWRGAALAVLAGLAVLAVVTALTGGFGDAGVSHPDEWDPRVAPLATYVEEARGLDFEHPVHVDFLSAEEYSEQTTTDESALTDEDEAELERLEAELRAFGFAAGELDLLEAFNAVSDAGTLAFYDPADDRIRVRGSQMTVGLEVTLVHELTHALQDQHFELEPLTDDDEGDSSARVALRGLVEGDALRIETAYVADELDESERAAYEEEQASEVEASEAATEDVPPFITASFAAPYALGQPFVVMLENQGGHDAVDEAFSDPPVTEEHLFDPASFLAGEDGEELTLDLEGDVEVVDEGTFGSPSWYLLLAERIEPLEAFEAALGWAGDRYATFERDDRACVRVAFAGDTASDEEQMARALEEWADAMPAGAARTLQIDGRPALESCDPGADAADPNLTRRATDALFVPSLWGFLVADAATVLDADGARCYAGEVLDDLTYEQITDPEGGAFIDPAFQDTLAAAFEACT